MGRPDLLNIEQIEAMQDEAYADRLGSVYGDFEVVAVEYDWERRKQIWTMRCLKCSAIRETRNHRDMVKGRYTPTCRECRKIAEREREERRKAVADERPSNPKWIGQVFGCWEVVQNKGDGDWAVRCTHCGHIAVRSAKSVREMTTPICWKCRAGRRGEHWDRLHTIWYGMRSRCYGAGYDDNYPNYGGRGISICSEWDDFKVFYDWAMSNGYAPGLTIDRKDVNGNYEPGNCRWATQKEQANNQRRNLRFEIGSEVKTLSEWCEAYGVDYGRTAARLKSGWSIEDALTKEQGTMMMPNAGHRRPPKLYELNGEKRSLDEWCAIYGVSRQATDYRMKKKGMTLEEALTAPKHSARFYSRPQ